MTSKAAPPEVAAGRFTERLDGLDLARAIAFGGMLLAHFAVSFRADDAGWLQALDNAADGRAAPLFCTLLGVGAGILLARGVRDRVLVLRGLALLVLGCALWPWISRVYLILPHYGVLLALVPVLRRIATRALLPVAALGFLVPSVITAVVHDHGLRGTPEPDAYGELTSWTYVAGQLAWRGGYPLVGWVGFVLVGLWVARQRIDDRDTNVALLLGGLAVAALQPFAAVAFRALGGVTHDPDAQGWAAFFDGSAHANSFAWYVVASGTAVASIAACLLVAPVLEPYLRPACRLGAVMLSAYLLHLAIGRWIWWEWRDRELPPLSTQVVFVGATFAALALLATLWTHWFRRGPVEAVLRRISRSATRGK